MTDQEIFDLHSSKTGKLEIISTVEVNSREDLSKIYTPGVGKVCLAISEDKSLARKYTIAGKTVAVISDGSAVLGFGNIGPEAALPVMEGKAVIFKNFARIDAFPICLAENDTEQLIKIIKSLAINFAAINLEDISAPRCFEIEERLNQELDIPVMHDDQHGTAIVTLAALKGAVKLSNKKNIKIVVSGAGAAGIAITKLLSHPETYNLLNISEIRVIDSKGLISTDRTDLNKYKQEVAELTLQSKFMNTADAISTTDVFIGVSAANSLSAEVVKTMNVDPIIFAMANPIPEIMPDIAKAAGASIVATGRSDFPNQINNALAYPGVFKALIKGGFKKATIEIKLAAANAIYKYHEANLSVDNILPSILDKRIPDVIVEEILKSNG